MKTIRELENKLLEKITIREEVSASYLILPREDVDDWRGKRLEERWHRADAEVLLLGWILNSEPSTRTDKNFILMNEAKFHNMSYDEQEIYLQKLVDEINTSSNLIGRGILRKLIEVANPNVIDKAKMSSGKEDQRSVATESK